MQLSESLTVPIAQIHQLMSLNLKSDPELAWTWHCQIACNIMDECIHHKIANVAAMRIMKTLFNVDMEANDFYKNIMSQYNEDNISL